MNVTLAADINKQAIDVYSKNHGNHIVKADVSEIEVKTDIDYLHASPPCKGYSIAGKNKENDERNKLTLYSIKFAVRNNAKVITLENVPNMKNHDYLDKVKEILSESGYNFQVVTHNMADYGVPQKRKRLMIYGSKIGDSKELIPKKSHENNHISIKNYLEDKEFKKSSRTREKIPEHLKGRQGYYMNDLNEPSRTVTNCNAQGIGFYKDEDKLRRFSYEQLALLQTFPSKYKWHKYKTHNFRLIGNSIPPLFMKKVSEKVKKQLD